MYRVNDFDDAFSAILEIHDAEMSELRDEIDERDALIKDLQSEIEDLRSECREAGMENE